MVLRLHNSTPKGKGGAHTEYSGKALRHEFKYMLDRRAYYALRSALAPIMKPDSHSGDYFVRSLYFDDINGSALREKEGGFMRRMKYRVRIYDRCDRIIKLERKEKLGSYTSKLCASISKEEFYGLCSGDCDFLLKGGGMERDMYSDIRTKRLAPAVIVDYMREAYVCGEGNVRVTFDSELRAGVNTADIFSDRIVSADCYEPGQLLMEVKYDDFLPLHIKSALQRGAYVNAAFSKYVVCRLKQFSLYPAAKFTALRI